MGLHSRGDELTNLFFKHTAPFMMMFDTRACKLRCCLPCRYPQRSVPSTSNIDKAPKIISLFYEWNCAQHLLSIIIPREEHIFYIKLLYGLLTTKNIDPISLDKFAKVLFALIKKKFLVPRSQLILDWVPLYEMFHMWDDSSVSMRGLLKSQTGFKEQLKSIIKV